MLLALALAVGASIWIVVLLGVGLLAGLIDIAWLTYTLSRDRRPHRVRIAARRDANRT
jgi:hypothetical protein